MVYSGWLKDVGRHEETSVWQDANGCETEPNDELGVSLPRAEKRVLTPYYLHIESMCAKGIPHVGVQLH